MGRNKKSKIDKKGKLSISISTTNFQQMEEKDVNKSQLINWLLEQYFNDIKK